MSQESADFWLRPRRHSSYSRWSLIPPHDGDANVTDLSGPYPQIRRSPCGGIDLDDVGSYVLPRLESIGLGGSLAPAEFVASGDTHELERRVRAAVAALSSSKA